MGRDQSLTGLVATSTKDRDEFRPDTVGAQHS